MRRGKSLRAAGSLVWVAALAAVLALLLSPAGGALAALGEPQYVAFEPQAGAFALVAEGDAATLIVDADDHPGVRRATGDLAADIERVTGAKPDVRANVELAVARMAGSCGGVVIVGTPGRSAADRSAGIVGTPGRSAAVGGVVIVGTLGRSAAVDALVRAGKLDVAAIEGRWEAYVSEVVDAPFAGVERALVIAGSDPRGTIYGIYDLSPQIGVSPWYWWADVPVVHRDALYVLPGRRVEDGPAVKYRGIFLNDEAPALAGWAQEKFGGFNHAFYAHVFELLLRLRGNYLWPAMWGSAFVDDDPLNASLADEYGIVMGTSHHEPMMRAHDEWRRYGEGPWDYAKNAEVLREFWRSGLERVKDYEKIVTIGMRGDGDEAMSAETNVKLLERIVADQREIIREVTGRNPADVPQVWALYKEVQAYYERGMRVPDDVTLLWSDDNWGNLRRLPTPDERERSGGAGIYYHLDYVGGPRNYKWLNTVPITKIQQQMNLAWRYGADRIWIVNVGDLKPMEFPTEFFLALAWDPERWPYERLDEFSQAWAAREFGEAHAAEIAALVNGYTHLNGRRKPEMLAPDTYSLVNYHEAERVLGAWHNLVTRAERLEGELPEAYRDAYFQLVLYPVKASAVVQALYVAVGENRLHARQGSVVANADASRARELFALDGALAERYHALAGGKWNHMMSQINLGYTYWQQPEIEVMPAVSEVRPRAGASPAVAIEGSETAWPSYDAPPAVLPPLDAAGKGTRWIELFNRGDETWRYTITADKPWITITPARGRVQDVQRVELGVDWSAAPKGRTRVRVTVTPDSGEALEIVLPVVKPMQAPDPGFHGFVESDGHIAIEAPDFARGIAASGFEWKTLPGFGRTQGGVTPFPVTAPAQEPGPAAPWLEYALWLYTEGDLEVTLHTAPSLDFRPGDPLRVALAFDDERPQVVRLDTQATNDTWAQAVADGVRRVTSTHRVEGSGQHVLKIWMVTPGVVIERIVIDTGGLRPSYLGPPESQTLP